MTTLGRFLVTLMAAAALIAVTVVAARYLSVSRTERSAPVAMELPAMSSAPAPAEPAAAPTLPAGATVAQSSNPGSADLQRPAGSTGREAWRPDGRAETPPPAPQAAVPSGPGEAAADEGLAILKDRPVEAQKRLSEALRAGVDGPKGKTVRDALNVLADRLQLAPRFLLPGDPPGSAGPRPRREAGSPRPAGSTGREAWRPDGYSKSCEVVSGDTLIGIGQRFLIPYELIMRLNRMSSPSLIAGETIKVIQGPVHVEILKGRYELQAWLGDVCLRIWPVGLGTDNKTPEGTFLVKSKLKDPPYQPQHKPLSEHRASGAPDNPLGTRWIDIGDHYGIHGTIDPASIGRSVSEGCIRMHGKDVEELYDLLIMGASKVTIRP